MVSLNSLLNLTDPAATTLLRDVRGNILRSQGPDQVALGLLTFSQGVMGVRRWLSDLAERHLTCGRAQLELTRAWKAGGGGGGPFALSAIGYAALEPHFQAGMKRHNTVGRFPINDPPPEQWEPGFSGDVHSVLPLVDADKAEVDWVVEPYTQALDGVSVVWTVERGDKLVVSFCEPSGALEFEVFGYQDGISLGWFCR